MKQICTEIPEEWDEDFAGICQQFGLEKERVFQMMIWRVIVYSDRLPRAMAEYEEAAGGDSEEAG